MGRIPKSGFAGVFRESQTVDVNQGIREAQQVSQIASSVANTAQKVESIQQQKQEKLDIASDQNYIATREIQFKKANAELARDFKEQYKQDPSNPELRTKFEERSEKLQTAFVGGLKRQDSKDSMTRLMSNQRFQQLENIEKFKAQQLQENILNDNVIAIDTIRDISIDDPSLSSALDSLKQVDTLKISNSTSLGEKNATRMHAEQAKTVASSFVDSNLANENISEVKNLLKNDRFNKALGAGGIRATREKIKSIERQREARAKKTATKFKKEPWAKYDFLGGESSPLSAKAFSPQLDPQGEELQQTLSRRSITVANAKEKFGIKLPFFRKEEAQALVKVFDQGRPQQISALMKHIDENTTPEQLTSLSQQLFFDEKQPALAAALSFAADGPEGLQTASKIVEGKNFLDPTKNEGVTGKNLISSPSDGNVLTSFDSYLKNSLPDPQARATAREAAFYHYTATQFQNGTLSKDLDEKAFKESINAVIGEPIQYNDSFIPTFKIISGGESKYADEDDFEGIVDDLNERDLLLSQGSFPVVGDGRPVNLEKSKGRLNFVSAKHGKYYMKRDNQMLLDSKTGYPFVVDLKAYHEFMKDPIQKKAITIEEENQLSRTGEETIDQRLNQIRTNAKGFR